MSVARGAEPAEMTGGAEPGDADPARLTRERRAEAGLRRWEAQRTPGALIGAILGVGGLLAVDVLILLPFLCILAAVVFAFAIALFVIGVVGVVLLVVGLFSWIHPGDLASAWSRTLAGIGLIGASAGFGALGWLGLTAMVRLLGDFARLHYRVFNPASEGRPS